MRHAPAMRHHCSTIHRYDICGAPYRYLRDGRHARLPLIQRSVSLPPDQPTTMLDNTHQLFRPPTQSAILTIMARLRLRLLIYCISRGYIIWSIIACAHHYVTGVDVRLTLSLAHMSRVHQTSSGLLPH